MKVLTLHEINRPPFIIVPAGTIIKVIAVLSWEDDKPNSVLFFAKGYRYVVLRPGDYVVIP